MSDSRINIGELRQSDVMLLQRVAEEAADKAVKRMLVAIGINIEDPTGAQADMLFLREWRESVRAIKRQSILTVAGTISLGLLGLIWWTVKH